MNLLIRNGNIITSEKTEVKDILTGNGIILAIGENIENSGCADEIDAKGKFIFPGGVDPHVHMCLPTPAGPSSDDFLSGSIAALYGGTTTIIDFVTPVKGESLTSALSKRQSEANSSLVDYSFHVSPVEWVPDTEKQIAECFAEGITSFKVYMAYLKTVGLQSNDFFKVLKAVGLRGGIVTVHCELGEEIEKLQNRYFSENHTEPLYHLLSRPDTLEADAVKKAIELANEAVCSLYIVHVSSEKSIQHIEVARKRGQPVYAETCPHYLLLNDSVYTGDFEQTAPYVISPPLRKEKDNESLWKALGNGILNTVGTDHCPFDAKQKAAGLLDFRKIPNGAGSIEYRLALLFTYGVLKNKISLNQLVDYYSTQPAKIFGLYPRKGEIAVGSDADLVIWNPHSESTISTKTCHQHCDINIYERFRVSGNPEYVIKSGQIAIHNDELFQNKIQGSFIKR